MIMDAKYDIKPIFEFAIANGEAKIVDRILLKALPVLLKNNIEISSDNVAERPDFNVPNEIYHTIKNIAENLTGKGFSQWDQDKDV